MRRSVRLFALVIVPVAATAGFVVTSADVNDAWRWPASGQERIERKATILRRIEGPARWCYPTEHRSAIAFLPSDKRFDACFARIEPVSDYIEQYPGEYIKRFYRGRTATSAKSRYQPLREMIAW